MFHLNRNKLIIFGLAIGLSLLACSLVPGSGSSTSVPSGPTSTSNLPGLIGGTQTATQNLTLTAVFAPQLTNLANTQAAIPTNTLEVPTQTPTITATATPITPTTEPSPTLTPPHTPTATLIPVTTLTPVYLDFDDDTASANSRSGPNVIAMYRNIPPIIDGDIGDWEIPLYAMENVVAGQAYFANHKDLSGEVKFAWDMEFFYIGVLVRDTKFVQEATGPQLWKGDSLELLIDTDLAGDFDDTALNLDDFQLGISPGNLNDNPIPEAYLWAPRQMAGVRNSLLVASRQTEDGYMMEIAIPWYEFDLIPATGKQFGFLFSISDNDSADKNVQQSVVSYAPQRLLHDPTAWYNLRLDNP